jgi:aminoglycoside N3'-acetyltransferase
VPDGRAFSAREVSEQLRSLGVERGGVLLVHTAFSRIRPIEGGPLALIDALTEALGPAGTLVMPSMSDDDDVPFDPKATACRSMGVVAETFWRLPGVLRSDSPHAFAARGPAAPSITAPHPVEVPHGLDSPVGRVYELDGQVLLLGVGHDASTSVHLAENQAGMRYLRPKHATVLESGRPVRRDYRELDHCCENFALLDGWLEAAGKQRRGVVGHGEARLLRARDAVDLSVPRLKADETTFLHPAGVCDECDQARSAIEEQAGGLAPPAQNG